MSNQIFSDSKIDDVTIILRRATVKDEYKDEKKPITQKYPMCPTCNEERYVSDDDPDYQRRFQKDECQLCFMAKCPRPIIKKKCEDCNNKCDFQLWYCYLGYNNKYKITVDLFDKCDECRFRYYDGRGD